MNSVISDERIELLQAMPVFGGISADTLRFLLPLTKHRRLRAGEVAFKEGEAASSLFVLEAGQIELLKEWEGHQYKMKTLARGDCCGEVSLIDLQPRSITAVAVTECALIEITAGNLHQLYERDPKQFTMIHMNMAREVCRRLREADRRAFAADMKALE